MELKKNPKFSLETKWTKHFCIGLCVALGLSLSAFEFRTPEWVTTTIPGPPEPPIIEVPIDIIQIPNKKKKKPTPPETKKPTDGTFKEADPKPIVEPKDEKIPEVTIEGIVDPIEESPVEAPLPLLIKTVNPFAPNVIQPRYGCSDNGTPEMYGFFAKQTRYPEKARRQGIEGTVHIYFMIDEHGNVTNAKVLKGIGGGCDEEALRVINSMPDWCPGTQEGNPVRVEYTIPYKFTLRNS